MRPQDFSSLTLSRYELRLEARQSASLPVFLGSTLRGAFGHALKEMACMMSHRDCNHCLVADRCIYPYLFETPMPNDLPQLRGQQRAPHPFILAPPGLLKSASEKPATENERPPQLVEQTVLNHPVASSKRPLLGGIPVLRKASQSLLPDRRLRFTAGDQLRFRLTLMGRATDYLSYVIHTVSEMARRGLGVERARFALSSVDLIDEADECETIYTAGNAGRLVPVDAAGRLSDFVGTCLNELERAGRKPDDAVKLRFTTPTRIRVEGDLQTSLSFELLIRSLLRRVSMLMAVHGQSPLDLDYGGLIARAAGVRIGQASLTWHDWQRYSNRQETKMKLGGFIGEIEYRGEAIGEFLPLILAGEILHVGTGTSFGLGKYEIVA